MCPAAVDPLTHLATRVDISTSDDQQTADPPGAGGSRSMKRRVCELVLGFHARLVRKQPNGVVCRLALRSLMQVRLAVLARRVDVRVALFQQKTRHLAVAGRKRSPHGRVAAAVLRIHVRLLQQQADNIEMPCGRSEVKRRAAIL